MNKGIRQPHIVVVADDFTGANDAGVSLALAGHQVDVAFAQPYTGDASVLVLNSDSRALSADAAAARVAMQIESLCLDGSNMPLFIKKMDSTLRGNPGAEIAALMQATGLCMAIVAPATPQAGRITRLGHCLVNGQLITDTEFASDPKTPVVSANIVSLLRTQTAIPCRQISLQELADAPQTANRWIGVMDAQTDDDLEQIVATALRRETPLLLVGSAGLCDAIARHRTVARAQTLLAIVGSMSEIAQRQIAMTASHPRTAHVFVDINTVLSASPADYVTRIVQALAQGMHCIVHTCADTQARHDVQALCERWRLDRAQLGHKICAFLGELTRQVVTQTPPDALYLSGGDVATAVASALGATGFRITGRVARCVPYGHFLGGIWHRPVMTKAGGFGDDATLHNVLTYIEESMSE